MYSYNCPAFFFFPFERLGCYILRRRKRVRHQTCTLQIFNSAPFPSEHEIMAIIINKGVEEICNDLSCFIVVLQRQFEVEPRYG